MRVVLRFFILTCLLFPTSALAASILLFGDSIVAGYGLPAETAMSVQLQRILAEKGTDVTVINGGVSGDTTTGGRNRLEWMLNKYKPDAMILALGGNDLLQGVDPTVTRENIHAMLKTARENRIPTALVAVRAPLNYGLDYAKKFDAIFPELARQYSIPLHPFFLESVYGKPAFMQADGIHPNAKGAELISQELALFLMKEGLLSKPIK